MNILKSANHYTENHRARGNPHKLCTPFIKSMCTFVRPFLPFIPFHFTYCNFTWFQFISFHFIHFIPLLPLLPFLPFLPFLPSLPPSFPPSLPSSILSSLSSVQLVIHSLLHSCLQTCIFMLNDWWLLYWPRWPSSSAFHPGVCRCQYSHGMACSNGKLAGSKSLIGFGSQFIASWIALLPRTSRLLQCGQDQNSRSLGSSHPDFMFTDRHWPYMWWGNHTSFLKLLPT